MTLREIAVIIAEKQDRTFDFPYILMLEERIKLQRSFILRQTLTQNILDYSYYLSNYVLDMERVIDNDNFYGIECDYLKSKTKLYPSLRVADVLYFVGSSDFSETYGKLNNHNVRGSLDRKYSKKELFYDIRDGYLYIFNGNINKIGIRDILENPEQLLALKENKAENEVEFQCTYDVVQRIISSIWDVDLRLGLRNTVEEEKMVQSVNRN